MRPAQAGSAALDECHVIEQRTDTGGIDNVSLPLVEGQGACEHVLSVAATSREAVDLREIHVHLGTAVQRVAGFCELERIGRERECLVVRVILGGDLGPYWHPENARIEVVGGGMSFRDSHPLRGLVESPLSIQRLSEITSSTREVTEGTHLL